MKCVYCGSFNVMDNGLCPTCDRADNDNQPEDEDEDDNDNE